MVRQMLTVAEEEDDEGTRGGLGEDVGRTESRGESVLSKSVSLMGINKKGLSPGSRLSLACVRYAYRKVMPSVSWKEGP